MDRTALKYHKIMAETPVGDGLLKIFKTQSGWYAHKNGTFKGQLN